jgi:hypothetical protein
MDRMQCPSLKAGSYCAPAHSPSKQLTPSYDAVLPSRQLGEQPIDMAVCFA